MKPRGGFEESQGGPPIHEKISMSKIDFKQGLVKGAKLCFIYPYFYFHHGESTSTASQLTSPASRKSKDLNKVSLLLQDLAHNPVEIGPPN